MVRSAAPPAPQAVNQAVGRPLFWWAEERGTQALSRVIFRLSVIKLVRNIIKLVRNLSEQSKIRAINIYIPESHCVLVHRSCMTLTQTLNANTRAQANELAAWPATSHEASELAAWPATSHTAVAPSKKKKKSNQKCGEAKRKAKQRKMCVQAVGPSGGSTVECNTGDGVPMGGMSYGVVTGVDGCASISAPTLCAPRALRRAVPVSLRPLIHHPNLPRAERVACA